MNRDIVVNFVTDKFHFIFIYILNSVCLITFFNLIDRDRIDNAYPVIIAIFFLLLLIIIEFLRYFRFNCNLRRALKDSNCELNPITNEQKNFTEVLKTIKASNMAEINEKDEYYNEKIKFISQWIHKFKSPISVIELIIQSYKEGNEDIPKAIDEIRKENLSLYENTDKVLNFIRLDEFSKDFEIVEMDIVSVLKEVINERKNQFIYNRIFPVIESSEDSIYVLSDKKWNRMLLSQIISNSIKYSYEEEKNKKVYFSFKRQNSSVSILVKDEGVGIPTYDIKKIFEPFFTGENGRRFRDSTGIGLYMCKRIADKLKHKLEIQSEIGRGTTVIITYLSKL